MKSEGPDGLLQNPEGREKSLFQSKGCEHEGYRWVSLTTLITGQTLRRELRGLVPQQRGGSVLRTVGGCGVGQKAEDQTANHSFTESLLNRSSLCLFLPHKCSFLSVLSLVLPLKTLPAWVSSLLSNASATVLYVGDCSVSTSCQDSFHECGRHSL